MASEISSPLVLKGMGLNIPNTIKLVLLFFLPSFNKVPIRQKVKTRLFSYFNNHGAVLLEKEGNTINSIYT